MVFLGIGVEPEMGAGAAAAAATTGVTDAEAATERRGAAGEDDAREAVDVEVEGEEEEEEVEAAAAAAAREGTRQRGVATTLDIVEERARRDIVVFGNSRPPDPICIEEELPVTRVERRVRLDGEVREEATRKRRIEWSCSFFFGQEQAKSENEEERREEHRLPSSRLARQGLPRIDMACFLQHASAFQSFDDLE